MAVSQLGIARPCLRHVLVMSARAEARHHMRSDRTLASEETMSGSRANRRRTENTGRIATAIALTATVGLAMLTGCGVVGSADASWNEPGTGGSAGSDAPLSLEIESPAADDTDVLTSVEIGLSVTGASETEVTLTDEVGDVVRAKQRPDGSVWVPERQLDYATAYQVVATASNETGDQVTDERSFSTMAQPGATWGAGLYLHDDQTVGVGMPIVLEFNQNVEDRAAVERRLFVTTEPEVEGAWYWFGDRQVLYRPKEYWPTGTTIDFRAAIGGMPLGGGAYGTRDRTASNVTVGPENIFEVDNNTKQLTITRDGEVTHAFPVSLGKPDTPSSSGNMVIMSKERHATFDSSSYGVPSDSADGYVTDVEYAMRLTWGGEFIHAAPWSVADQGERNVSHGCINLSTENSATIFELAHIGDPVIVKNTEVELEKGNGWTAWDLSWEEYQTGSALND